MIQGLVTSGIKFVIDSERVAIDEEEMRGVLLRVQVFVRSPQFTQRNFFSDSSVAMLPESAAISESFNTSAV